MFNSYIIVLLLNYAYFFSALRMGTLQKSNGKSFILRMTDGGPYKGPDSSPILDGIRTPTDMKRLDIKQLKQLANELRWETINSVSKVGGHLGSSLGVVELTVALHYIYNAPVDKIIWDVAHQSYPHKILTGRRSQMGTLRQLHGISGYTNRFESEYDCFGAGMNFLSFPIMNASHYFINLSNIYIIFYRTFIYIYISSSWNVSR
jgi:hypothetical protein